MAGALLCALCFGCAGLFAQDSEEDLPEPGELKEEASVQDSSDAGSFFDGIASNARRHLGFNLGVSQMYSNNPVAANPEIQSVHVTSVTPRAFANFGRRRSRLHVDVNGGYKIYKDHSDWNKSDIRADVAYNYALTRRANIQITDRAFSRTDDAISNLDFSTSAPSSPTFSYTLLQDRQRITQNDLTGSLEWKPTRKNALRFFGSYQVYRNSDAALSGLDSDGAQAGMNYEYNVVGWLSLASSWSAYIDNVDSRFRDSKIYRLEAGGFHFKFSRTWELQIWGGLDILDSSGTERQIDGTARALLSHRSRRSSQYLSFQRAMITTRGLSEMLQSDILTAGLGQAWTRWMRFQLSASYMISRKNYSAGLADSGKLKSYDFKSSLEFSLLRNVVAVVAGGYQNQKNTIPDLTGVLRINRYVASFGLQYLWPSLRN